MAKGSYGVLRSDMNRKKSLSKVKISGSQLRNNDLLFCRKLFVVEEDVNFKGETYQVNVARAFAGGRFRDLQLKLFVKPVDGLHTTKGDKPINYQVTVMGFYNHTND